MTHSKTDQFRYKHKKSIGEFDIESRKVKRVKSEDEVLLLKLTMRLLWKRRRPLAGQSRRLIVLLLSRVKAQQLSINTLIYLFTVILILNNSFYTCYPDQLWTQAMTVFLWMRLDLIRCRASWSTQYKICSMEGVRRWHIGASCATGMYLVHLFIIYINNLVRMLLAWLDYLRL